MHSAQGLTKSEVLMNIETKSRTVARDWYYVGISRAKAAQRYSRTTSKSFLPPCPEKAKTAALDLKNKTTQKINERGGKRLLSQQERSRYAQNNLQRSSLKKVMRKAKFSHAKNSAVIPAHFLLGDGLK